MNSGNFDVEWWRGTLKPGDRVQYGDITAIFKKFAGKHSATLGYQLGGHPCQSTARLTSIFPVSDFVTESPGQSVRLERLDQEAIAPTRAHTGDAAYDLYTPNDLVVMPGLVESVSIGFRVAIPEGYAGLVLSRSGNAARGLVVANAPGLIDSGYRGGIIVLLRSLAGNIAVEKGDRIAQLLIIQAPAVSLVEGAVSMDSERGEGGIGSTGR